MKKYVVPTAMFATFEAVAIALWLTKDNLFYLFNFTYIGAAVALGVGLFIQGNKNARRVTQLLVGLYMLVYLGLVRNENMQIEGFWYYYDRGRSRDGRATASLPGHTREAAASPTMLMCILERLKRSPAPPCVF